MHFFENSKTLNENFILNIFIYSLNYELKYLFNLKLLKIIFKLKFKLKLIEKY